jgi:hypothetical protein
MGNLTRSHCKSHGDIILKVRDLRMFSAMELNKKNMHPEKKLLEHMVPLNKSKLFFMEGNAVY